MIAWLKDTPIQRKLMLIIFATSVVAMLLMRGAFFTYEFVTFRQTTVRQLSTLGEVIANNSTAALAFQNPDDAREILGGLKAERYIVAAALYDRSGKLFATYPGDLAAAEFPAAPGADGFRFESAHLDGFQPVVQRDKRLGTLYLKYETGTVMAAWLRLSLGIGLGVIAIILVVTYLLTRVLQRQISRPILALAETAQAVSERRDYSVRAVKLGNDEVGRLTDAFNQMLVELQRIHQELEQRVRERTAQLATAHDELAREQARLRFIFDTMPVGLSFALKQPNGQVTRLINDAHLRICGLTREQAAVQENFRQITHPDDRPRQAELVRQLEAGTIDHFALDKRYVRPDGQTVWVMFSSGRRQAEGGAHEDLSIVVDITERKRAEEALRASEAEYRTLFESIDEGYCIIEMIFDDQDRPVDYRFLGINPAFEKQTGLHNAQGKRMRELSPGHEAHWFETYGRIAVTGVPERFQNHAAQLHRWFDVYAFRYGDPKNRQVAIIFNNITERKAAEDRLATLNADLTRHAGQLEAANKELEAFSYSVSHDLRAPLRHINGFASLLEKHAGAALDDKARRHLATIASSAKQMGRLIDDLLSFSRMGRTALAPGRVDQDAMVATVIRDGRYDADGRVIQWDISPLPAVEADAALLRQVWSNLVDNAVKYSGKAAQPRIAIHGAVDAEKKEAVFSVADNGAGFDMAYAGKLFGVFQRLHGPAEFEGTGIGLANVRRIVVRHGGRTWAEGRVGEGATFYFSIPVTPTSNHFTH